jgi:Na+-driven multidrug efflux pump
MGGGALLNIGLAPIFIFVFHGESRAPLGCGVRECILIYLYASRYFSGKTVLSINPRIPAVLEIYREILKFGVPRL